MAGSEQALELEGPRGQPVLVQPETFIENSQMDSREYKMLSKSRAS